MRNVQPWRFQLDRHEDPPPPDPTADPPTDPATPVEPPSDPATGGEGDDKDDLIAKWKAQARENEKRAKANADKAKRFDQLEAANKTESERLAAAKDAAEKRAQTATARAVQAEVRALAADQFEDSSDAAALLDLTAYADEEGEIDADKIKADLAALLKKKPHLAKRKPGPLPDPSQGSRGEPKSADLRTASRDDLAAEAAKYGLRLRS
jgi:hypothetical protein